MSNRKEKIIRGNENTLFPAYSFTDIVEFFFHQLIMSVKKS